MKTLILTSLLATLFSMPSHALVQLVNSCQTSNGLYQIEIINNQGIGPVRSDNLGASIQDREGNVVASFSVEKYAGIQSISFGRQKFIDIATKGQDFTLAFPSTNYRHISINATLADGTQIDDENVTCNL